jgi:lipid-A-disaccharide synthase
MDSKHLFIFAGEPSGDLHGHHLIEALKKAAPEIYISGVCGPEMRKACQNVLLPMEDFAVMGFTDVIKALPHLYRRFKQVRNHILRSNPDGVILIDYPGFNLRLAKSLRARGYRGKIIHYICPSIWAHGKGRIKTMCETLDLLLTIYPFEEEFFSHTLLPVEYVGNPLTEYAITYPYNKSWKEHLQIPKDKELIGIFPGSRTNEIKRNFPKILQAAELLHADNPHLVFGISCANIPCVKLIQEELSKCPSTLRKAVFLIPSDFTRELMQDSHSTIAKSGTVTLELALYQKPTVVVYELSKLNWFIAKFVIRLKMPYYCIVNILKGTDIFPELIENGFTAKNLYEQSKKLHQQTTEREKCLQGCLEIKKLLKENKASEQASKAILNVIL